ncbi:mechanosensitive ion channel family protein [Halobaculum sp. P14]|uniref:mechanosensitive ion channel family protein n=1 Tax=Halobaculum sp. P14 TaxID=3421638 RepID=UPI003EBD5650
MTPPEVLPAFPVAFAVRVTAGGVAALVVAAAARALSGPVVRRIVATPAARGVDETAGSLLVSVCRAAGYVAAAVVGFTVAGFGTFLAALTTLGSAAALAGGFAAQDLLSNLVAGAFIIRDEPFAVGDWIRWADGREGRVEDVGLRVTRVRTYDDERITVPNSRLANQEVTNPVAYGRLREEFLFQVNYDDDPAELMAAIREEAAGVDAILDDPAPEVRVESLAPSYLELNAVFWVDTPDGDHVARVKTDLAVAVQRRFDAEGYEMPGPQRVLSGDLSVDLGAARDGSVVAEE